MFHLLGEAFKGSIIYFRSHLNNQMGPCISDTHKRPISDYRYSHSIAKDEPTRRELRTISFHADIANVQLKKYPYRIASPIFRFGQQHSLSLEGRERSRQESLKWKTPQKCDFEMSEHELKSSCLQVQIQDEGKQVVAKLAINLYLIATGPFHQDFALNFTNGSSGRIIFDLRLSQVIELGVHSLAAQIQLLRDHPGEEFFFSIQAIAPLADGQTALVGDPSQSRSYSAPVVLEKKVLEVQHGEGERSEAAQGVELKEVESGKLIAWSKEAGALPTLTTRVLASELHNTYFQILIWKQADPTAKEAFEFFADTYVSLYQLFGSEAERQEEGGRERECRTISLTEKIEHYGKDYGKGLFRFRIHHEPYLKQYQICVHTEMGIRKTTPIFAEEAPSQACFQLEELQKTSEQIEQNVIKLSGCQSRPCSNEQLREMKGEIEIGLEKIFHLLEKTAHPPAFLYRYGSQEALLRGQKVLLTVGARAAEYLQLEDPVINDVCWLILISLAKRGEFSLSRMGFHEQEKQLIRRSAPNAFLKEKLKLVTVYRAFTCRLLALALNSLTRKGSEYQNTFAEVYCACAYFKVPEFRKELLGLLWREGDPEIDEWRGFEFSLRQDAAEGMAREGNVFVELFDWQQECYAWVEGEDGEAREALAQRGWRQCFRQRGQEFFYFLKYWVTYVQSQLPPHKDIQWRYFPGYNRLLRALFAQMKRIPILEYPDALLESCTMLLANEKLANPMVAIVLNRVNAYDITAVLRGVDFLDRIFSSFSVKKRPLPISFNYSYFFKAVKVVLEGESSLQITSLLTLLYTHFALFPLDFRRSLSMYLLGAVFWRLFLHWSHTVRYCFHYLITYRVYGQAYHAKKNPMHAEARLTGITETEIMERYKLAIRLATQEEEDYAEKQYGGSQTISSGHHYYKRMRMKIYQRIRKNSNSSSMGKITREDYSTKEVISAANSFIDHDLSALKPTRIRLFREREYHSEYELGAQKIEPIRVRDDNSLVKFPPNLILFQKVIPEEEMELQDVPGILRKRVGAHLKEFRTVEKGFVEWLEGEGKAIPPLSYEFEIDNREIRPKEMENW